MNQQNWPQSRRPLILISLNLKGTPVKCVRLSGYKKPSITTIKKRAEKHTETIYRAMLLMHWHFYTIT